MSSPTDTTPGGTIAGPAVAAQLAVQAADLVVHTHPVQARALLRTAAEIFEAIGQQTHADKCRATIAGIKEHAPRQRHRPGLTSSSSAEHRGSRR